jgi:hypothetical protein
VPSPYLIENSILEVLSIALLAIKVFALADAAFRRDALYVAADKQNKAFWLILLAVFLALHFLAMSPMHIFNMIGTVAAFVYLADVRPQLQYLSKR